MRRRSTRWTGSRRRTRDACLTRGSATIWPPSGRGRRLHRRSLAFIGSSDFHHFAPVGLCRTFVFATERSVPGLLDAREGGPDGCLRRARRDLRPRRAGGRGVVRMPARGDGASRGVGPRSTRCRPAAAWLGLVALVVARRQGAWPRIGPSMARDLQRRLFDLVSRAGRAAGIATHRGRAAGHPAGRGRYGLGGRLRDLAARPDPRRLVRRVARRRVGCVRGRDGLVYQGRPAAPVPSTDPIAVEDVRKAPTLDGSARGLPGRKASVRCWRFRSSTDAEAAGSLVFYFRRRRRFPADDVALARALGDLGGGRDPDRGPAHANRSAASGTRCSWREAVETLASSLDYLDTLKAVAADGRAAHRRLVRGRHHHRARGRSSRSRSRTSIRSGSRWRASSRRKYPPDPASAAGSHHVVRTGQPFLLPHLTDEMIDQGARSEAHRRDIRALRHHLVHGGAAAHPPGGRRGR